MRFYFSSIILGLLFAFRSFGQTNYDSRLISPELLKNANVVTRMEDYNIVIKDSSRAIVTIKYAKTILNSAGDNEAQFACRTDKLITLQNMDGVLYDAFGKKLKTVKRSEILDVSGTDDETLAQDSRIKAHNFNWKIYPYTVEYTFTREYNAILFLPNWQPLYTEKNSIENSTLVVSFPKNYTLRFKEQNLTQKLQRSEDSKYISYLWTLKNLPALVDEKYSPEFNELTPAVYLAPSSFSLQGHTGNMNTWKGLGSFYYELNKGRDQLPESVKEKVHQLTDQIPDTREKVLALYRYMQKNTRYVSIQLGIGGLQTFDANYVAGKGYGDCKALSNFTLSLLKEAGVSANCVLIKAGESENYIRSDFPSDQFNHVILCVPSKKDTIWLECTSSTIAPGYLSGFTANRYALLVDEQKSSLIHTPIYKKIDNLQTRTIIAEIDSEGNLKANVNTHFKAEQQDPIHGIINNYSKDKIEQYLKEQIDLPSYDITSFNYKEEKNTLPIIHEELNLTANNFSVVTGRRLFLNPNILNKSNSKIPEPENRKLPIEVKYAYVDIDTVEIKIPPGYFPESIPKDISITNKFGSFRTSHQIKPEKISYIRYSERNSGQFPAKDAMALSAFYDSIYKADRDRIVMVKGEKK